MAGGTGGHIFPGLAVAESLRDAGWRVHWMGVPGNMESQWVPQRGFAFEPVEFGGVRGKGFTSLVLLPLRLLKAFWQSLQVVRRVQPNVVVGLGGYITFPGGMMSVLMGKPLVLHEQNSVAGMANKVLAGVADRIYSAFPNVLQKGIWVGNPLRQDFLNKAAPHERFAGRTGPLKLWVVGGSLGAQALNDIVPKALALLPEASRPVVVHQSGAKQIEALKTNYATAGVSAELTPFIEDTAQAFADADVIICRSGASTVTEIAAVGAAAIYVPFPFAVDDHQTTNANFLVKQGAGWLMPQAQLTPEVLAERLATLTREELLACAEKAWALKKTEATREVVAACEALAV
jgi:UDP-N-acetylglucosamine--N-acetylmuramyl-(pentapeptide) pyrophosphoryl-undecaprenol N-acetylglucosamine transferase